MNVNRTCAIFLATFIAYTSLASAEIKTYEGTGEYIMSDFETPDIAKQRAKVRAEQHCAEQAGVYVKSYTRVINSQVKEDEVEAIANTIINIVEEKFIVIPLTETGGSFKIIATIKAEVDSEKIDSWMSEERIKNLEMISSYKELQEDYKKQEEELVKLKSELANAKTESEKKMNESRIVEADNNFLYNQYLDEGRRYCNEKNG